MRNGGSQYPAVFRRVLADQKKPVVTATIAPPAEGSNTVGPQESS